jgi:hypothetical protein
LAANAGGIGPVTNVNAPAKKRPILLTVVLGIVAVGVVIAIAGSLTLAKTGTDTGPVSSTAPNVQPAATSLPADQAKATEAPASPPTQAAVTPPSGGTGANYVGPTVTGVTGLAPQRGDVIITSDSVIQTRGGQVVVAARAKPSTGCTIKVQYLSGNATVPGLEPKTTDISGNVSWTWVIAQDTKSGTWPVMVTCGGATGGTTVTVP